MSATLGRYITSLNIKTKVLVICLCQSVNNNNKTQNTSDFQMSFGIDFKYFTAWSFW